MSRRPGRHIPWGAAVSLSFAALFLAACSGTTAPLQAQVLEVCDEATQVRYVAAGDLTDDGNPEFVVSCQPLSGGWDPGAIEVHGLDANGTPTRQAVMTFDLPPADLTLADLDGDGRAEIIVSVNGPHERTLVIVATDEGRDPMVIAEHVTAGELQATTAHDLTGNGAPDLLLPANNLVLVNEGSSDQPGPFRSEGLIPMDAVHDIHRADINGDGQPDTAFLDHSAGIVRIYPNDGAAPQEVALPPEAPELHVVRGGGDLDGDGVLDLVVSTQVAPLESELRIVLSQADGTWEVSEPLDGVPDRMPEQVLIADLTRDGALDLVTVPIAEPDQDDYELTLVPGNGDGTFGTPEGIDVDGFPYRAIITDMTADGNDDLVFIREGSERNELLLLSD